MLQEEMQDSITSGSAAQIVRLSSSEAQDLEAQIVGQKLNPKQSKLYFGSIMYSSGELCGNHPYATASQIQRLAYKHRTAVKGLNPWAANEQILDFCSYAQAPEPIQLPEPELCEFCGNALDYIAVLNRAGRSYDWEIEKWSEIPLRCSCGKAQEKWDACDAEEQRKADEERQRKKEADRKAMVERQLAQSGIKKRFLSRTFANFQTNTPGRAKAYRLAKDYADNFASKAANGEGLYIEGTFGTGKTHLAAAIAIQLMEQGHEVIFKTADDLLRDIKATFDEKGREGQKVLDRVKRCELLVIDDIGKEQATDWSTSQFNAIINDRYESMKPLIITTNFNENDLIAAESPKGVGSHRIMAILSRLHETCRLITMSWQDWRGTQ